MDYDTEEIECIEAQMKAEFKKAALGEIECLADWAPRAKFLNHRREQVTCIQSVKEVMVDSLDTVSRLSVANLMPLLSAAARGEQVQQRAIDLIDQMAEVYASHNAEES